MWVPCLLYKDVRFVFSLLNLSTTYLSCLFQLFSPIMLILPDVQHLLALFRHLFVVHSHILNTH